MSEFGTNAVRLIIGLGVTATEPDEAPVTSSRLLPSMPNPFADVTDIRFELDTPQHVSLVVYDALGRRVAVLVEEQRAAGLHRVQLSARTLASGTYLIRLQTKTGSDSAPITLTR